MLTIADGFETPTSSEFMTDEQMMRIRAELEAHQQRQQQAQTVAISGTRSDLDEAHSQSFPARIPIHSMASDDEEEMSPLVPKKEKKILKTMMK